MAITRTAMIRIGRDREATFTSGTWESEDEILAHILNLFYNPRVIKRTAIAVDGLYVADVIDLMARMAVRDLGGKVIHVQPDLIPPDEPGREIVF